MCGFSILFPAENTSPEYMSSVQKLNLNIDTNLLTGGGSGGREPPKKAKKVTRLGQMIRSIDESSSVSCDKTWENQSCKPSLLAPFQGPSEGMCQRANQTQLKWMEHFHRHHALLIHNLTHLGANLAQLRTKSQCQHEEHLRAPPASCTLFFSGCHCGAVGNCARLGPK